MDDSDTKLKKRDRKENDKVATTHGGTGSATTRTSNRVPNAPSGSSNVISATTDTDAVGSATSSGSAIKNADLPNLASIPLQKNEERKYPHLGNVKLPSRQSAQKKMPTDSKATSRHDGSELYYIPDEDDLEGMSDKEGALKEEIVDTAKSDQKENDAMLRKRKCPRKRRPRESKRMMKLEVEAAELDMLMAELGMTTEQIDEMTPP